MRGRHMWPGRQLLRRVLDQVERLRSHRACLRSPLATAAAATISTTVSLSNEAHVTGRPRHLSLIGCARARRCPHDGTGCQEGRKTEPERLPVPSCSPGYRLECDAAIESRAPCQQIVLRPRCDLDAPTRLYHQLSHRVPAAIPRLPLSSDESTRLCECACTASQAAGRRGGLKSTSRRASTTPTGCKSARCSTTTAPHGWTSMGARSATTRSRAGVGSSRSTAVWRWQRPRWIGQCTARRGSAHRL